MAEIGFVPLAAGGAVKFGTYTGDGAASHTINLGVTPKWVCVWRQDGMAGDVSPGNAIYGGLALKDNPCSSKDAATEYFAIAIQDGGFKVARSTEVSPYIETNNDDSLYYYLYGI